MSALKNLTHPSAELIFAEVITKNFYLTKVLCIIKKTRAIKRIKLIVEAANVMALNVKELNQKLLDLIDKLDPPPKGDKGYDLFGKKSKLTGVPASEKPRRFTRRDSKLTA